MQFILALLVALLSIDSSRSEEELLHFVDGDVGRGNYTYFSLMYEGPIVLYLYSTQGDADLYVSQINSKPTFEPDSYCLQSSTCGLDVISIPADFTRPVGIGVYGHTAYETSSYILEVYSTDTDDNSAYLDDDSVQPKVRDDGLEGIDYSTHQRKDTTSSAEDRAGEDSILWRLVSTFFELLLEVLFL